VLDRAPGSATRIAGVHELRRVAIRRAHLAPVAPL
jgi:hypothetical protein